jgi:hypothetical protein
MDKLDKLWEEWKAAFKKYSNQGTFSDLNTETMNDVYDRCYKLVTSLKQRSISPLIKLDSLDNAFLETNTNTKT